MPGMLADLFDKYGWATSPYGQLYTLHGVGFVHAPLNRLGKPFGGQTAHRQIGLSATHDIVYGHDHLGGDTPIQKLGERGSITVVNLGCALPHGHIEPYVGHGMSGWWYGIVELTIYDGRIQDINRISMLTLEREYSTRKERK
jgi:hypothetical protein